MFSESLSAAKMKFTISPLDAPLESNAFTDYIIRE